MCFGHVGRGRGRVYRRQAKILNLSLPKVNLKILFWLRPDDTTRQEGANGVNS